MRSGLPGHDSLLDLRSTVNCKQQSIHVRTARNSLYEIDDAVVPRAKTVTVFQQWTQERW